MDDRDLLRYSRHILLDEIGIEGQEKLLSSAALVIGCGGCRPAVFGCGGCGPSDFGRSRRSR